MSEFGWRAAFLPPAVIALIAIYVRMMCPESPYWVRMRDRRDRIASRSAAGHIVSAEDRAWMSKAGKVGIRQMFLPDLIKSTLLSVFVASSSVSAFSTVGLFCGYVLWPFVSVYLRERTGSFQAAFLLIPVMMIIQALVVWFYSPEHAGKELDEISV